MEVESLLFVFKACFTNRYEGTKKGYLRYNCMAFMVSFILHEKGEGEGDFVQVANSNKSL
ncbi:MAG: hypothetical protein R3E32_08265 [Chitinophagales bacterium]